jgi:preprotein translocase subunit SecB
MNTHSAADSALPPADSPHLRVLAQYVKELSFRNLMAAAASQAYDVQPTIDMGVEVKSRPMGENREAVEVDLCINVQAKRQDSVMFSVDLVYSGLFQFMNVRSDDVEPLIWIECPRLLFPDPGRDHARRRLSAAADQPDRFHPALLAGIARSSGARRTGARRVLISSQP